LQEQPFASEARFPGPDPARDLNSGDLTAPGLANGGGHGGCHWSSPGSEEERARRHGSRISPVCAPPWNHGYRATCQLRIHQVRPVAWSRHHPGWALWQRENTADRPRPAGAAAVQSTVASQQRRFERNAPLAASNVHHHLAKRPGSAPATSRTRFKLSGARAEFSRTRRRDPIGPRAGFFKLRGRFPRQSTCPPSMFASRSAERQSDFFEVVLPQTAPWCPDRRSWRNTCQNPHGFRCQGRTVGSSSTATSWIVK